MPTLYKRATYTAAAQMIFVQQQSVTFYMQGDFLFVGEYFLRNDFL
jgi:hypothetical protein